MYTSKAAIFLIILALSGLLPPFVFAQDGGQEAAGVFTSPGPVPPGTVITMKNWQQYRQYMSDGFQALFEGKYFWKLPPDFQMTVGLTHHYPLPKEFVRDTDKYSRLVKIVDLPEGAHTITGYIAGLPFPNITEPLKGWKLLVDTWYTYVPHLLCGFDSSYNEDRFGNINYVRFNQIYRKLGHISDHGQPVNDPRAKDIYYSEYQMLFEPEQIRYTSILILYYMDPSKPIDSFLYIPGLRRTLRLSSGARCSPVFGTDFVQDDINKSNFNGDWRIFDANVVREAYTFNLNTISSWKNVGNLDNYFRPVFFPKPIIGNWETRPVWVLDVRRIPSQAEGYCYVRSIFYVDKETYMSSWKEVYDSKMELWKILLEPYIARDIPHEGWTGNTDNWFGPVWDVQNKHLTLGMSTDPQGRAWKFNEDCQNYEGENYDDVTRFSTAAGLSQIMR